jgi:hypothetical protein
MTYRSLYLKFVYKIRVRGLCVDMLQEACSSCMLSRFLNKVGKFFCIDPFVKENDKA